MKKILSFWFFVVSLSSATISCDSKKETSESESADTKLVAANTDSTFEELINFVEQLKDVDVINKDKDKLLRVKEIEVLLRELNRFNIGDRHSILKDSSGFITYEEFIKRRKTFVDSMAFLIRKKNIPNILSDRSMEF